MIAQVRTARPAIVLDGRDYYAQLAPYLKSMTYTDNCDGKKADDFQLELADRDGKFISEWMPKKGAFLDASIIAERWFAPNSAALSLDCGRFWIDSIEFVVPQRTVTVKGTSLPTGVRIKASIENRGWDKTTLRDIAQQIAGENQMSLDYRSDVNPRYGRTEQHDESALAFLMKRANDAKLAIKIHRNQVVIFDEQKLEEAAAQFTLVVPQLAGGVLGSLLGGFGIDFGTGSSGRTYQVASAHFTTKVNDTTKKAKVSHTNPETGDTEQGEHTAEDEEQDTGDVDDETSDQVNDDPDSIEVEPRELDQRSEAGSDYTYNADASSSLKAKAHVRDKNKDKNTATIQLALGNPLVAAGMTFDLKGVGQFDGKWFVQSVHHEVAPEYNTELHVRRCLKGY
jgi:phage protein D